MINELRQGLRTLLRARGFTVMAVACIGLGIAVTATIFSAVNAVLLRPLPYHDADRLVLLYAQNPARGIEESNISYPDYESWRDAKSFSELGVFNWRSAGFAGPEGSERIDGADASANLFRILGTQPMLGRLFTAEEEQPGKDKVVLLGYGLWQRFYGGDRALIGRAVRLSGVEYTVIGIMPPWFRFPYRGEYWRPLARADYTTERANRTLAGAVGRLAPNATLESARAELAGLAQRLEREYPATNQGWGPQPVNLREDQVGDLGPALLLFFGAVAIVLLIACANVANLLLARGLGRQRELAIRLALGASRARVVRQLLSESFVLAALGGMLGTLLSFWGIDLLRAAFPENLPAFIQLDIDAPVLAFALAISLLTGISFGLVPALQASRPHIHDALKQGARNTAGASRARLRNSLVVVEVALSVLLLVGGGLTLRSLIALHAIDPGFNASSLATMRINLPAPRYPDEAAREQFMNALLERIRAMTGVQSVGAAQGIPFSGWNVGTSFRIEGLPPAPVGQEPITHVQAVTPDFFPTLGVTLLRGRGLQQTDRMGSPPVAVVNQAFVSKHLPGQDRLGKRVKFRGADEPWLTIVGVTRDYRHYHLTEPMGPAVYVAYAQSPRGQMDVVARTRGDASTLVSEMRRATAGLDPEVTVGRMQTMQSVMDRQVAVARLQRNLIGIFAGLALLLAIIGMYGVLSYNVAQRNREIGIRVALGASRADVLQLVVGEGARLTGFGVVLGLGAAFALARMLASRFWGIQPIDPLSFTAVPAAVCAIALLAIWVPARRAAGIEPTITLRSE